MGKTYQDIILTGQRIRYQAMREQSLLGHHHLQHGNITNKIDRDGPRLQQSEITGNGSRAADIRIVKNGTVLESIRFSDIFRLVEGGETSYYMRGGDD